MAQTEEERTFYRVSIDPLDLPLRDYLENGYDNRQDFARTLRRIFLRWQGREGEAVCERHDHIWMRFLDTPGKTPDEAWVPCRLLERIPIPAYVQRHDPTPEELLEKEIDEAFGF